MGVKPGRKKGMICQTQSVQALQVACEKGRLARSLTRRRAQWSNGLTALGSRARWQPPANVRAQFETPEVNRAMCGKETQRRGRDRRNLTPAASRACDAPRCPASPNNEHPPYEPDAEHDASRIRADRGRRSRVGSDADRVSDRRGISGVDRARRRRGARTSHRAIAPIRSRDTGRHAAVLERLRGVAPVTTQLVGAGDHAHGPRRGRRSHRRARAWSRRLSRRNRSILANWWRACARSCAASRRATPMRPQIR